jgi:hypothetical protein
MTTWTRTETRKGESELLWCFDFFFVVFGRDKKSNPEGVAVSGETIAHVVPLQLWTRVPDFERTKEVGRDFRTARCRNRRNK